MNLDYLDKIIPTRWNLLFRYYFPFFKKPSPFHFRIRKMIDASKKQDNTFELNVLVEILQLIDQHAVPFDPLLDSLANKIIKEIIYKQEGLSDNLLLEDLFTRFDINKISLNKLLIDLSLPFFTRYISKLTRSIAHSKKSPAYYQAQIIWCAKLCHKFSLQEKLQLIVSSPESFIGAQMTAINQLIDSESESFRNGGNFFKLVDELQETFLQFCFEQRNRLTIKDDFFSLFNAYYNRDNQQAVFFIHKQLDRLAITEQAIFLKDLFHYTTEPEELLTLILNTYPKNKSSLIDAFILDYVNNPMPGFLPLFNLIQKKIPPSSLNLCQMLSISTITKKQFDAETLLAAYSQGDMALTDRLALFSPEIQSLIIETAIATVQTYISISVIAEIPRKAERINLHSLWAMFIKNECIDSSKTRVQQLNKVIEKIPLDIRIEKKVLFDFFIQLYQLFDSPIIQELNEKRKQQLTRQALAYEINQEERRKIIRRIALGG